MQEISATVLNIDKLTYAAKLDSLAEVADHPHYALVEADVSDAPRMRALFREFQPDIVIHLAAESHVDRSIDSPAVFINTNVVGTFIMLEEALRFWRGLAGARRDAFRFHHVSTDEVFGSLAPSTLCAEMTRYDPSSPYAASKAASDHLVRAWHRTYKLPVVLSNCGNNYGPYQFPEKLIPRAGGPRENLITFVADRPGHDLRYAVDASRVRRELGWTPFESFETGLRRTVSWYLSRRDWWEPLLARVYCGERLGSLM